VNNHLDEQLRLLIFFVYKQGRTVIIETYQKIPGDEINYTYSKLPKGVKCLVLISRETGV
jgi:hypothetical protein